MAQPWRPSWRSLFTITFLLTFATSDATKELAWNGHAPPGSTVPSRFTPYYVPPGAKAYADSSPFVHYSGSWGYAHSSSYVGGAIRITGQKKASVTFSFTGTGIEWFGNCDKRHGNALVYIDGRKRKLVNTYCKRDKPLKCQRLFWAFDLPYGKHVIKIINTGTRRGFKKRTIIDVDAFVVTRGRNPKPLSTNTTVAATQSGDHDFGLPGIGALNLAAGRPDNLFAETGGEWKLLEQGTTGVNAMQLAVISDTHAIIVDKVEHNPLTVNGHPAWATLYNLNTHAVKPLAIQSNSFCAGGTFLSNGTLINVGGNPVVEDRTAAADFGDSDGLQAIRLFHPCDGDSVDNCEMYENHDLIRMASPRWYNTVVRVDDGSAMIIGGSTKGGWINNSTVNNPTIEFFPPKSILQSNGLPIHLQFLVDTLNSNLFPIAFSLPDGTIFMAANQDAMIYDWKNGVERRLPPIPNGVRVTYPMAGTGALLPLSPSNDYQPEVLLCGGSTIDDQKPSWEMSAKDPASSQCSRIVLTDEGIAAGWEVEEMPQPRTMGDAVLLPTGKLLLVNGAGSGISGYGNVKDQVGMSNADTPVLTPVIYDPQAGPGERFSSNGLPTSQIPRMYHSVATLTPNGDVMIAGSNPNLDRSEVMYGTEYRVEWIQPPYMSGQRPEISKYGKSLDYNMRLELEVKLGDLGDDADIQVALMDPGFSTHAVHANMRLVYLEHSVSGNTLTVIGPPNKGVYPPGPGWIYVLVNNIPSKGVKIMVGDGEGPPVDEDARMNLLLQTAVDQYEKSKDKGETDTSE